MGDIVKDMTAKFGKLNKFEGNDFTRWQKKMHFLLTKLKVVYVLSTPMPEFVEDEPLVQTRRWCKWENDDYIYRGHILNGMSDALFDVYQNVGSAKELWDQLESKYMAEDASSKNIIDKLQPSWKDFKHGLKHNKDELSLVQLGSHFRIEESLRSKESGEGKGKEIIGSSVNMIEDGKNKNNNKNNKGKKRKNDGNNDRSNKKSKLTCWKCGKTGHFKKDCRVKKNNGGNTSGLGQGSLNPNSSQVPNAFTSVCMISSKDDDSSMWHARLGHVHYKGMLPMSKDNLIPEFDITLGKWNKKYVVTFIDDASRFCYVYLCHAKDEALDKFKIYKIKVELQQNDLIKTLRTDRGGEYHNPVYFQSLGIIHETMAPYTSQQNGVSERMFDEAMQSHDVAFWKEAINDEMNSIMENNTWILSDLPPGCKPLGCKWIFKRKMKVDGTIDKFKSRLVIQGFRQKEGIDYFDTYALVA
ncbi:zinc finger, CCHC-type containing protein [Tanacetum coccineum]